MARKRKEAKYQEGKQAAQTFEDTLKKVLRLPKEKVAEIKATAKAPKRKKKG